MEHVKAPNTWPLSRGDGVTIAIVDTGTDASRPEFQRRSPHSYAPTLSDPWKDLKGHGTMCAAIACGSNEGGGRYNGVAPGATLLSARSTLRATDLYPLYEHLLEHKLEGSFDKGLVVSNSFALEVCQTPTYSQRHPYADLVRACVRNGIVFVFAAGNNHADVCCGYPESNDHPNTIWAVNSIDEVITVGTVDWDESNQTPGRAHANSSRGSGQWSTRGDKPDVVAPTYGEVAWGAGYEHMEWWGTSGACPQVAGLVALLLSQNPALTPDQIRNIIRSSARSLPGQSQNCVGAGIIDCEKALESVP
jgi:serine protease AprX